MEREGRRRSKREETEILREKIGSWREKWIKNMGGRGGCNINIKCSMNKT